MIHLGKIALYHCRECNIPLVKKRCSCGEIAEKVKITPPGDVRPAFTFDKKLIGDAIKRQFGSSYLPEVVLLNNAPGIDRNDEVIIDGRVAGIFYYDIWEKEFKFQPRPWYASLLNIRKNYVIADSGAVNAILKTSNLMAPGVKKVDEGIKRGDEVIVLNEDGIVVATGKAWMDGEEMKNKRGMAVKIRWRGIEELEKGKKVSWKKVLEENKDAIFSMVGNEEKFIENVIKKYNLPSTVSFSGGKDSLATLHLLLDAGYELPMLFLNTGLEFEETVKHVYEVADRYGLELLEGKAGNKFWKAIDFFGPPARDYRWCCKTCKLGIAAKIIKENFPNGILSFIGQRRYESEKRASHGKIWKNPWVEGQIGVSPIQNWTSLHIWLYLFLKKAKWNVLYKQGFHRIGCWLCPASDMAEFILKKHEDWEKFNEKLDKFARKHKLPEEWISLGLWRWRNPPKWSGIRYEIMEKRIYRVKRNKKRIENFLQILGNVRKKRNEYEVNGVKVKIKKDGIIVFPKEKKKIVEDLVYRAINCVGCNICYAKCKQNAIYMKDGKAFIGNNCIHCLQCMYECPVIVYR